MSEAILYALLATCAVSLMGIAGGALYHWRAMRRLQRMITDAAIEARAWDRVRQDLAWKTALFRRTGITPLEGKGKRHE